MTTPKAGMPEPRVLDDMLNQLEDCINAPCKCGCAGIYPHELRAVSNMLSQKDAEVAELKTVLDNLNIIATLRANNLTAAEQSVERLRAEVAGLKADLDELTITHNDYKERFTDGQEGMPK